MHPELKRIWIEALLSGKFQQGKQYLKLLTPQGIFHCCLGVLCDINNVKSKTFNIESGKKATAFYDNNNKNCLGYRNILPKQFEADCGLTFEQAEKLSEMNDTGSSFKTIAEYIDKNL